MNEPVLRGEKRGGCPGWDGHLPVALLDVAIQRLWARCRSGPEHLILRVADVETEDLTVSVSGHAGGNNDGTGDDPMIHPGFDMVASTNTYGKSRWSRRRVRNTSTCSSISAQIRETVDLETPVSQPNAFTKSSAFLVEVPVI